MVQVQPITVRFGASGFSIDPTEHKKSHVSTITYYNFTQKTYKYNTASPGCGKKFSGSKGSTWTCGSKYNAGQQQSQSLLLIDSAVETKTNTAVSDFEFELTVSIPVQKVWDDNNNRDGIRPSSINVTLYENGEVSKDKKGNVRTITIKEQDGWKGEFKGIDRKTITEKQVKYTIQEEVPSGYTEEITGEVKMVGNKVSGFTITNSHEPEVIKVKVQKLWDDDNNRDGIRPNSVILRFWDDANNDLNRNDGITSDSIVLRIWIRNGTDKEWTDIKAWTDENGVSHDSPQTLVLNDANNWTFTTGNLYKFATPGIIKEFKIEEIQLPSKYGYTDSYDPDVDVESKPRRTPTENKSTRTYTYMKYDESTKTYTYTVTNTHIPEKVEIPIEKTWDDDTDRDGLRPGSISVKLYSDDPSQPQPVQTGTITGSNNKNTWNYTFTSTESAPIYKYRHNGILINYRIEETKIEKVQSYDPSQKYDDPLYITGNGTTTSKTSGTIKGTTTKNDTSTAGFEIINTHEPEVMKIKVIKIWDDKDDLDEYRPNSITLKLLADGKPAKDANGVDVSKVVINKPTKFSNEWSAEVTNLFKYRDHGTEIQYTIVEDNVPTHYTKGKVEIVYDESIRDNDGQIVSLKIKNTHTPQYDGYIEITGKVWHDGAAGKANDINGTFGNEDKIIEEDIKVRLKDSSGNSSIKASYYTGSGNNIEYCGTEYAIASKKDGTYTIKVNYDNSQNVYKLYEDSTTIESRLNSAYVEFEYDGMKYTTVKTSNSGANTSKAKENETSRNNFDSAHQTVKSTTSHPDKWSDKNVTAITKDVISFSNYSDKTTATRNEVLKYCTGNSYKRTNPEGAWKEILTSTRYMSNSEHPDHTTCSGAGHAMSKFDVNVKVIQNVNLGLFEREQPDVAIFIDLSKVEVTMNNQKYTYLYGVKSNDSKDVGLQVKFQNKDTYTYKRPVNPADIAYIQETANSNAMSVQVTYNVKVANLSTTLITTVNKITNYFDPRYTLETSGWTVTPGAEFNKAISGDLNITLEPQTESEAKELKYTVSAAALKGLLNEEATLNNAVEIESYSTKYGKNTLYAEQGTGGKTNNPYGGYDYNSHPGNAGIKLNNTTKRLEATKLEDDTDIAPSFVLHKDDESKTLSGTIWEDKNVKTDGQRLGNGYEDGTEAKVQNVKVELYNLDGTLAKLYDNSGNPVSAVQYSGQDGSYAFRGVVTGEYFMKFTYGDDTTELGHDATTMDGGDTTVNARNYKSTIITDSIIKNIIQKSYTDFTEDDKKWHITHQDGYSISVDNMLDRLEIEDLEYSNFHEDSSQHNGVYIEPENMTAYTKPFKTQVEFEVSGQSQVENVDGKINVPITLDKMDFGIIERPREDLYVEKNITFIKVTLANGQVIAEGDPRTEQINYVRYIGPVQGVADGYGLRSISEKKLIIEMDQELIQGAKLEVRYDVQITNNNEIDYDYGNAENYQDIGLEITNEHITTNPKAKYYYFGDHTGLDELKSKVEFIDYMNTNLSHQESTTLETVSKDELNGLIESETLGHIQEARYNIFRSADGTIVEIGRGESTVALQMVAEKLLVAQDENQYDNSAEILKIDAKTARTITESQNGKQVIKSYLPGNYCPVHDGDNNEYDDDRVEVIITPPTGIVDYIIPYLIAGLVGLIVIGIGVMFIKRKVLIK